MAIGQIKPVLSLPESCRRILDAPHGQKQHIEKELVQSIGKSSRTWQRHCKMIRDGRVNADGTPLFRKPGPPKGYGLGIKISRVEAAK
jgi:hypothetical protein